jgi:hypothetical protein
LTGPRFIRLTTAPPRRQCSRSGGRGGSPLPGRRGGIGVRRSRHGGGVERTACRHHAASPSIDFARGRQDTRGGVEQVPSRGWRQFACMCRPSGVRPLFIPMAGTKRAVTLRAGRCPALHTRTLSLKAQPQEGPRRPAEKEATDY